MSKNLYCKLAAVLLGLFCLIGILYILLTFYATRLYFQEASQKLNHTLAENLASEKILMVDGRVNDKALQDILHMLMIVNPGIEVYLLDPNGTILSFSAPPGKVKRKRVSMGPLKTFLNKTSAFPILGDDPRDLKRKKVFSAAPIFRNGQIQGYLYVILGGEEFDTVVQMLQGSYILRLTLWAVAGGLLFAFLAGLLLFFRMTVRLRRLTAEMESFREGDFSEPPNFLISFKDAAGDEIDRIGSIFAGMAERIIQQINELRHIDALRRQLVADSIHDLRTPLTSLRGYLETLLLKEGELTADEQRNYLTIAMKHSHQLGTLVSELFELAKLDSPEVQVHMEPFSMGEIIQDIVQKFQLSAEKKMVRLHADFAEDLPFVIADIGLIERVLENLIENALRYTPEKGVITIAVVPKEGGLTVVVSDTGSGIRPEVLPHLFDRTYRLKGDRPKDAEGVGLGLLITKRILELHGSDIEVRSEANIGTTFTFTLPGYKAHS
jgi:two-component system OmpR family sensor kinase